MSLSSRSPFGYPDVIAFFGEGEINYSWPSTVLAENDHRVGWFQQEAQLEHRELWETTRSRVSQPNNKPPLFTAICETRRPG